MDPTHAWKGNLIERHGEITRRLNSTDYFVQQNDDNPYSSFSGSPEFILRTYAAVMDYILNWGGQKYSIYLDLTIGMIFRLRAADDFNTPWGGVGYDLNLA